MYVCVRVCECSSSILISVWMVTHPLILRNKIFEYVLTKDHHERKIMQADRQKIGKHFVSDQLILYK